MEKETTITIANWAGVNSGDDAIFLALLDLIRNEVSKNVRIFVLADNDKLVRTKYNIEDAVRIFEFYRFYNLRKVIKFLRKSEIVIYGGGDLISGDIRSMSFIGLAKILGLPVICCGVGVIPIKSRFARLYTRIILNHVDLITLRDEESKRCLEKMGVTKPPIYVTADLAFLLAPNFNQNRLIQTVGNEIEDANIKIGINIRPYEPMYSFYSIWAEDNFLRIIAKVCDQMIDRYNAKIVFLPMVVKERTKYYHKDLRDDNDISQKVINIIEKRSEVLIIEGDYTPKEFEGLLSNFDLIVAMRLHALLLASIMGVPVIALEYAPKIKSFMNLINQSDYCIPITEINEDKLVNAILDRVRSKNKENLTKIQFLTEKAKENGKMVKRFLENNKRRYWKFYIFFPAVILVSLMNYVFSMIQMIRRFTKKM